MFECCMIMEAALESVFVLPHAISIQGDGNVHPIKLFLNSHFKSLHMSYRLFLYVDTNYKDTSDSTEGAL